MEAVAAVLAAVIAAGALWYTRVATQAAQRQVVAAEQQMQLQRQLRIDSAQPYVWVDIRPSDEHGHLLMLYVGNSGPTVATHVKVTFDPTIDLPGRPSRHREAVEQLASGLSALPPGRVMQWHLGASHQQIPAADPSGYKVRIEGRGPFGPLEPLEYRINLTEFHWTLGTAPGTLYGVAVALDKSADKLVKAIAMVGGSDLSESDER